MASATVMRVRIDMLGSEQCFERVTGEQQNDNGMGNLKPGTSENSNKVQENKLIYSFLREIDQSS